MKKRTLIFILFFTWNFAQAIGLKPSTGGLTFDPHAFEEVTHSADVSFISLKLVLKSDGRIFKDGKILETDKDRIQALVEMIHVLVEIQALAEKK